MREHLFKGQTRRKGERVWMNGELVDSHWVYGGLFQGNGDFSVIYTYDPIGKRTVYSDTVCEYTGQLDRDGMKIFEHDVMKFTDDEGEDSFYRVEWRENRFIVADVENSNAVDDLDRFFCDSAIVVGNKFDGWKQEEKE